MHCARDELVEFLDRKAFEPVLHLCPTDLDRDEQQKLDTVKVEMWEVMRRYHEQYKSAEEVRQHFLDDVRELARRADVLKRLELPQLCEIEGEFLHLCDQLGITSSSP